MRYSATTLLGCSGGSGGPRSPSPRTATAGYDTVLPEWRHRLRRGSSAAAVAATDRQGGSAAQVGAGRVDHEALPQHLTADQHPEAHRVAPRQGHLGGDLAPHELEVQEHHDALLGLPG